MKRIGLLFVFCLCLTHSYSQQTFVPTGQDMSNTQGSASVSIGQIHYITFPNVWAGVQQPMWNYYSIVTNSDIGTTTGDGTYKSGEVATIAATSTDMCYAFARWSDNDTSNPRSVTVTQDSTFTAIFEKIQFNLSIDVNDSEHSEVETKEVEE